MSLTKRQKIDDKGSPYQLTVSQLGSDSSSRTSSLIEPALVLEGHQGTVLASRFNLDGSIIASGGTDRKIFLWNTPTQDFKDSDAPLNFVVMPGHKSAITSIRWFKGGESLVTSSADRSIGLWDLTTAKRIRKFVGHEMTVNEVDTVINFSRDELIASASDDGCVCLWDSREKTFVEKIKTDFPLMTVVANNGFKEPNLVFTAGIDATVLAYDVRNAKDPYFEIESLHSDAVTSLSISEDNGTLISNSMDSSIRAYDCSISNTGSRVRSIILEDAPSGNEKLLIRSQLFKGSDDRNLLISGSGDNSVTIWDLEASRMLGKLHGHDGTVVDIDIHPYESIVLSGSTDGTLIVREV
ncbi:hypothetical protein DASC09_034810 [Saccharomycopsis crataegensis]|uniref:WD40 repeat-like protein n=1 Tax=Saccharomycopsis crataegensis TaxID=43959 RepID=A0AAV5QNF1_9ASCO|nr:hypothetical protein DASC09_034810 [Saccharomycopsis crataegensis]